MGEENEGFKTDDEVLVVAFYLHNILNFFFSKNFTVAKNSYYLYCITKRF